MRTSPYPGRLRAAGDDALSAPVRAAVEAALAASEADPGRVTRHAATMEEAHAAIRLVVAAFRAEFGSAAPETMPRGFIARAACDHVRGHLVAALEHLAPEPPAGDVLAVVGALQRVSERLEAEWSEQFADRLSGPDGMDLVVELAHDLRSPLTSILFLAETLQRGRSGPLTNVQERQLGLIYSAAFGLSAVASDVIELARGGDRLVDLDPIPFAITDIFESVRDIILPIAEEKGLEVRLQAPERDFRTGHPVALSRVLLNLTTNALKFTNEGYVELEGRLLEGNQVEFSVRDTGRGIPEHAMATLFEPFRRRQKDGEYAFSGTGLGLSICRKLVEAMGATLEVQTEAGQGTRFFFTIALPAAEMGLI